MYTYIYVIPQNFFGNVIKSSTHLYRPQQRQQHAQHDEDREGVIFTMKIGGRLMPLNPECSAPK